MSEEENEKPYDLEERTELFAKRVRAFVKRLVRIDAKIIRSSGSVGANYIEANESLSKKDFLLRIKICRKEAKESRFWLRLIDVGNDPMIEKHRDNLVQEATELTNIFGAILRKSE